MPPERFPTFTFDGFAIYSGLNGNGGIRAELVVNVVAGPANSYVTYLRFCDAAHLGKFADSVPPTAGGPRYFYFPIELVQTILTIIRIEPSRAVGYLWSNPGGGGTPIGFVSI